jgi:DNA-binding transcriptional MocR family regulator
MDETELVSSAEKNRVKVYGMSRYYSDLSKQETTNTVLLGYSTMGIDDIGKAVSLLRDSWFPPI